MFESNRGLLRISGGYSPIDCVIDLYIKKARLVRNFLGERGGIVKMGKYLPLAYAHGYVLEGAPFLPSSAHLDKVKLAGNLKKTFELLRRPSSNKP